MNSLKKKKMKQNKKRRRKTLFIHYDGVDYDYRCYVQENRKHESNAANNNHNINIYLIKRGEVEGRQKKYQINQKSIYAFVCVFVYVSSIIILSDLSLTLDSG